jgi:protein kinase-like protein
MLEYDSLKKRKPDHELVAPPKITSSSTSSQTIITPSTMIGKGGYGCVFRPPLKCHDYQGETLTTKHLNDVYFGNMNFVMKIRDPDEDDEEFISAFVRKMDPSGKYFLPLIGDIASLNLDSIEVQRCGDINNSLWNNSKIRGYYIKFGGETLRSICENQPTLPSLTQTWKWFEYLVQGLRLLHENDIFHFDIRSENIVISSDDNHPRLIDFGLSFKNMPKWTYAISLYHPPFMNARSHQQTDYAQYTAVTQLYNYFEYKHPTSAELRKSDQKIIQGNKQEKVPEKVPNIETDPLKFYRHVYKYEKSTFDSGILYPNREKIDMFQLVTSFFDLDLIFQLPTTNQETIIRNAFKKLYTYNKNPNVDQCWTVAQNLLFIEKINLQIS